jgi:6-pyruvoyltetrahydropterin/6-carboxytetrahydropterin synthase
MFAIAVEITFNAGHYLTLAPDTTEPLHRHEWRVRITVASDQLDQNGLVMDFHQLQDQLRQIVTPLEQVESINDLPQFSAPQDNPSTERIARYIFDQLQGRLPDPVRLTEVMVWETPGCRAAYRPS